jgi:polyisoprenoid-binding protein YceI
VDQRDTHLKSADFLDVENHPDVTFKSTSISGAKEKFKLTGDLTIRGTTRPITLDVTLEGTGKDPQLVRRTAVSNATNAS